MCCAVLLWFTPPEFVYLGCFFDLVIWSNSATMSNSQPYYMHCQITDNHKFLLNISEFVSIFLHPHRSHRSLLWNSLRRACGLNVYHLTVLVLFWILLGPSHGSSPVCSPPLPAYHCEATPHHHPSSCRELRQAFLSMLAWNPTETMSQRQTASSYFCHLLLLEL